MALTITGIITQLEEGFLRNFGCVVWCVEIFPKS